jgi:hypothetical protein
LGLGSLPPERLKYASGLFNMMRNLGGAVGIAVCGATTSVPLACGGPDTVSNPQRVAARGSRPEIDTTITG